MSFISSDQSKQNKKDIHTGTKINHIFGGTTFFQSGFKQFFTLYKKKQTHPLCFDNVDKREKKQTKKAKEKELT